MNKLKAGKTVELRDEWNQYEVLKADDSFALLKCVVFVRQEDLGDKIMCTQHDQEIWVAQFHAWKYETSSAPEPSVRCQAEHADQVARVMDEYSATAQAPQPLSAAHPDAIEAARAKTRMAFKRG
jgi:hypothetical protein